MLYMFYKFINYSAYITILVMFFHLFCDARNYILVHGFNNFKIIIFAKFLQFMPIIPIFCFTIHLVMSNFIKIPDEFYLEFLFQLIAILIYIFVWIWKDFFYMQGFYKIVNIFIIKLFQLTTVLATSAYTAHLILLFSSISWANAFLFYFTFCITWIYIFTKWFWKDSFFTKGFGKFIYIASSIFFEYMTVIVTATFTAKLIEDFFMFPSEYEFIFWFPFLVTYAYFLQWIKENYCHIEDFYDDYSPYSYYGSFIIYCIIKIYWRYF